MRALAIGLLAGAITALCLSEPTSDAQTLVKSQASSQTNSAASAHDTNNSRKPSVWGIHNELVTKIRGKRVENRDGQFLGKIQDFILDPNTGEVRFVLISSGGWLGLGKRLKAAPAELLSTATAKKGVVALAVGRRRWQRAE